MMNIKGFQLALMGLVLASGVIFGTNEARAEKTGNGGGAWVCRRANGEIRWSKLVDLFEAENEFGLSIAQYPLEKREIVDQVLTRLSRVDHQLYSELAPHFARVRYLDPTGPIPLTPPLIAHTTGVLDVIDDSLHHLRPPQTHCARGTIAYEQIVNYKDDGDILVQEVLMQSLSQTSQAALVAHEAIYAFRREIANDVDSVLSRRIVGLLFSTLSDEELKTSLERLNVIGPTEMTFVDIRPGSFVMGSSLRPRNRPAWMEAAHTVRISKGFEMLTTEVTQNQWVTVMGYNPSYFKNREHCPDTYKTHPVPMCPNHPVEHVDLEKIRDFLSRLNVRRAAGGYVYRLPTEEEWEYAARAGSQTDYSFGSDPSELSSASWHRGNSGDQTHAVAGLRANNWGLYDMHGNVWEWAAGSIEDSVPSGAESSWYWIRGGAAYVEPPYLQSSSRVPVFLGGSVRPESVGFRLVRTRR